VMANPILGELKVIEWTFNQDTFSVVGVESGFCYGLHQRRVDAEYMAFGWVTPEEHRLHIAKRTREGIEDARRRGIRIGRPRKQIDLDEARQIMKSGTSMRKTAKILGVGAATLCRALKAAA